MAGGEGDIWMVGTMCVSSSPAAVQAATMVLRSQPNHLLHHGGDGLAGLHGVCIAVARRGRHYKTGGLFWNRDS